MIKISYEQLNDPIFMSALEKLDNHKGWDSKTTWDFNRIKKEVDKHMRIGIRDINDVIAANSMKDENGELQFKEVNGKKEPVLTNREVVDAKFEEVSKRSFEVKNHGLETRCVIEAGLTNKEIRAIEGICCDSNGGLEEGSGANVGSIGSVNEIAAQI